MPTQPLIRLFTTISLVLVTLTTVCFFYQILYLIVPFLVKRRKHAPEKKNRYAILIAARNEEAVLPHLLDSINAQDYPRELIHIFVVADNCTDETARVAREHGATVFERFNKLQVGKGYAVHYLLDQIEATVGLDSFDDFLIFDADNLLQPDYIRQMNKVVSDGYEAFTGYRNTKNFGDNWLTSGYGIWYLHDSAHLNQSRMLLGTTCAVTGTGFGFSRALLRRLGGWNFFTLTEDIEFSTWCATHGVCIGYCHDAILFDEQPARWSQSFKQRSRWTQGGLQVSLLYAFDLVKGLFRGFRTAYASFETATLSLWGTSLAALSSLFALSLTFLTGSWMGLLRALVTGILGGYWSLFLIAVLILATEWKRIHATTEQKIKSAFTFPLFMFTFVPISLTAVFRKFQWEPIAHTVAISAEQLGKR